MSRRIAGLVAAAVLLVGGAPAAAQTVVTPKFPVGSSADSFVPIDVAGGYTGLHLFTASGAVELHRVTPGGTTVTRVNGFSDPGFDVDVAEDPRGGYMVVWTTTGLQDSYIAARRVDDMGAPIGDETPISPPLTTAGSASVAGLPTGSVVTWAENGIGLRLKARLFDFAGHPVTGVLDVGTNGYGSDVASFPNGAFAIVWAQGNDTGLRLFAPDTSAGDPRLFTAHSPYPRQIAASPDGTTLAIVHARPLDDGTEIRLLMLTAAGVPLGDEIVVEKVSTGEYYWIPDAAFDFAGDVYVVWGVTRGIRARAYDATGIALGPAVQIATGFPTYGLHTARLANGDFVTGWTEQEKGAYANVVTLCPPGTAVCGDGVVTPRCERCDDGAGNSDVTPGACRTDCLPARCGDGIVDPGEECDDGNLSACDGCDGGCRVEVGWQCGDGVTSAVCGERCDDGNAIAGDGCSATCEYERIPGGGTPRGDCLTEWTISNPTNVPLLDKHGTYNATQTCVDDDPQCDTDGGVPGGCTFHAQVCVDNSDIPDCVVPGRLATWTLTHPSADDVAHHPALADLRAALQTVPGVVVGPTDRDLCTGTLDLRVPLRGEAGRWRKGKVVVRTTATTYDGRVDEDKLKLICVPAGS